MAFTPAFIAAGAPIYDPATAFPASLEVDIADLPAGIRTGDFLMVCAIGDNIAEPLTPVASTGLVNAGYQQNSTRDGLGSWLVVWVGIYDPADFPVTIDDTASLAYGAWRIETAIWRPSGTVQTLTGQYWKAAGPSGLGQLPADGTGGAAASTADGLVVQLAMDQVFNVGAVVNAQSMTERHRQAAITNRVGGFVIADIPQSLSSGIFATYASGNLTVQFTVTASDTPGTFGGSSISVGRARAWR